MLPKTISHRSTPKTPQGYQYSQFCHLKLAVWFGFRVVFQNGGIDIFAVASAAVSLMLLQSYPIGAVATGDLENFVFKLILESGTYSGQCRGSAVNSDSMSI